MRVAILVAAAFTAAVALAQRGPSVDGQLPSQIHATPPRAPIPSGPARIIGRLLDRERRTPISNASVSIELLGPGATPQNLRPPVASRIVTTSETGEFIAPDLVLGDYTLVATADGYTPARRLGSTIDNGESVTLTADRLDGAVTIRHSRVGTLFGVVKDTSGAALAGIPVRILHHVFAGNALVWQPLPVVTTTDGSGRYGFTNVPPGDYVVGVVYRSIAIPSTVFDAFWGRSSPADADRMRARLMDSNAITPPAPVPAASGPAFSVEGFRWFVNNALDLPMKPADVLTDGGRRMTTFAGADTVARAQVISLAPGESRTGVDITVRIGRGVRVSGELTGDPAQIANVGIRLLPAGEDDVLQTFAGDVAATITDDQGRFTFLDVPPGRVVLDTVLTANLSAPGSLPRRVTQAWARMPLDVGPVGITDLRVALRPLLTVRGRFEFADASIDPRPSPSVLWMSSTGARNIVVRPRATGPASFVLEGLAPGRYVVNVSGFGNSRVTSITAGGQSVLHRAFELLTGDLDDLVVTFTAGVNRIQGYVRNADGAGVEGAQIVLFPADYRGWTDGGRSSLATRSLKSGPRGAFAITALTDGDYVIAAFGEDRARDWEDLSALEAIAKGAATVKVGQGKVIAMDVLIADFKR